MTKLLETAFIIMFKSTSNKRKYFGRPMKYPVEQTFYVARICAWFGKCVRRMHLNVGTKSCAKYIET